MHLSFNSILFSYVNDSLSCVLIWCRFRVSAENVFGASDACELTYIVTTHKEPDREKEMELQEAKRRRLKQLDGADFFYYRPKAKNSSSVFWIPLRTK